MNIRHIVIVGGGSSGWMTATLLALLPDCSITLIEASDIPIIGVGESTNGITKHFHRLASIDEKGFMRASNAAFKVAIRFDGFDRIGNVFTHPFGRADHDYPLFSPRAEAHYATYQISKLHNRISTASQYWYAYQLDAGLYGEYLKRQYVMHSPRFRHIVDKVVTVERSDNGDIARIITAASGNLEADLYIDCSGFRSLLLEQTLQEPFHSVRRYLPNDRAIAARVPYINRELELRSYTNCVGLSAGWVWEIPLWSRLGTGYVYSSHFLSRDQAEAEYRNYLGCERVKDLTFNHIEMRSGRHERAWIGNCVGIGVSYGFLEPLESTGLSLTQTAIIDLLTALLSSVGPSTRDAFNRRLATMFDTTRDFVAAHFVLTSRADTPYWKHLRYDAERPDGLLVALEHATRHSYAPIDNCADTFYQKGNWDIILSGMGVFGADSSNAQHAAVPDTEVHEAVLKRTIYDGDYEDPQPGNRTAPADLHPIWAPTW